MESGGGGDNNSCVWNGDYGGVEEEVNISEKLLKSIRGPRVLGVHFGKREEKAWLKYIKGDKRGIECPKCKGWCKKSLGKRLWWCSQCLIGVEECGGSRSNR